MCMRLQDLILATQTPASDAMTGISLHSSTSERQLLQAVGSESLELVCSVQGAECSVWVQRVYSAVCESSERVHLDHSASL